MIEFIVTFLSLYVDYKFFNIDEHECHLFKYIEFFLVNIKLFKIFYMIKYIDLKDIESFILFQKIVAFMQI